jgi:putative transcriptional regulator
MILRIKEIMDLKKVKRAELGEATGISPSMITKFRQESSYPKYQTLILIAEYLDVDVRELLISTKPDKIAEAKKLIQAGLDKLG